ncbi:MAG: hypothetical protein ACRCYY_13625 [Trueperaceae bacterium]
MRRFVLAVILLHVVFLSGCFPVDESVYEPVYYDPGYDDSSYDDSSYDVPYESSDTYALTLYNDCQSDTPAIDVYVNGVYQITVYDYDTLYIPSGYYNFYVEGQQEVFEPEIGYQYFTYSDETSFAIDGDSEWVVCEYY